MNKIPRDRLFVQVTYQDLLQYLRLILFFKINCEIYVKPGLINSLKDEDLERIKRMLDNAGIRRQLHAPVYDPCKYGLDIAKQSYLESVKFCRALGLNTVIMHLEYASRRAFSIEQFKDAWGWIADAAAKDDVMVLLENHNEATAEPILTILDHVDSENIKACFDIGHFNAFGVKDIIAALEDYPAPFVKEIHLSDNFADGDSHLPLGRGNIDFPRFFETVQTRNINAAYTIEAKDIWGVIRGIRYLKKIRRL